jgi:hypothetical protein
MLRMTHEPETQLSSALAFTVASFQSAALYSFSRYLDFAFLELDLLEEEEWIALRQFNEAVAMVTMQAISPERPFIAGEEEEAAESFAVSPDLC